MRNLRLLDTFRDVNAEKRAYGTSGDHGNGCFRLRSPIDQAALVVVASNGDGWDHVSVSRNNRCPNWPEMQHVRMLFFLDSETAMQLHVPAKEHINEHPHCLHLWRPQTVEIPRPPGYMVA